MNSGGFSGASSELAWIVKGIAERKLKNFEIIIQNSKSRYVELSENSVETVRHSEDRGYGIRCFEDGRLGFAYSSMFDRKSVEGAVDFCLENSKISMPDEFNVLPGKMNYDHGQFDDGMFGERGTDDIVGILTESANRISNSDSRVKKVFRSHYNEATSETLIFNSNGLNGEYKSSAYSVSFVVIAEERGDSQMGWGMDARRKRGSLDSVFAEREALERAVSILSAKPVQSFHGDVLFDEPTAIEALDAITSSFFADFVDKGKSPFKGRINERVASETVTMFDDGTIDNALGSSPFDGEGIPSRRTVVVENGILKNFLHNTYTAKKAGVASTGNAGKRSYKSVPDVGITNFCLKEGVLEKEEIVSRISKGLYVTEILGMHTVNPISGEFSVGVSGRVIKDGRLSEPTRGIAIAGNIFDFLKKISMVGKKTREMSGYISPCFSVTDVAISGT